MPANQCNWGVPDWRDGTAYPAPDDFTSVWRWQFLRRRSDYREDWLLHHEQSFRRNVANSRNLPAPEGLASWAEHFAHIADMPLQFIEGFETGVSGHIEKYGVRRMLDPAVANLPLNLFESPKRAFFLHLEGDYRLEQWPNEKMKKISESLSKAGFENTEINRFIGLAMCEENRLNHELAGMHFYEFDLTEPLDPQIKQAKSFLARMQNDYFGKPRKQKEFRKNWPLYLRILDARNAGETYRTIGETLMDLNFDPDGKNISVEEFDSKVDRLGAAKSWAKKMHGQALGVAMNGFP